MWTLNPLQDGASRVVNQARPADHDTLMRNITRRYTDGNDEFHCRNALSENRQTGSIEDYVDRFLVLSSRVQNLPDAEAKFALVKGLKPEVQIHMLGQHHVNPLAEALEELRVYGHARRGTHTTGTRADFGTSFSAPMDLDLHESSPSHFRAHSPRTQGQQSGSPRQAYVHFAQPRRFSNESDERRGDRRYNSGERETPERRPRDQARYDTGADSRAQKGATALCYACGGHGHMMRDCPLQTHSSRGWHGNPYGRGGPDGRSSGNGRGARNW